MSYTSLKDNMKDKQYLQIELWELMTKQVYPYLYPVYVHISDEQKQN